MTELLAFSTEGDLGLRLVIHILAVLALVGIYYRASGHREQAAAFVLFGIGVFFVTRFLYAAEVGLGFALGLFAVFSMLRYRTEAMGVKEMTWLFLVIAMALLSAVAPLAPAALLAVHLSMILSAWVLETRWLFPLRSETTIEYERIDNIHPPRRPELIADLEERTGLDIIRVDVLSVSFLKDTATLRVHYRTQGNALTENPQEEAAPW